MSMVAIGDSPLADARARQRQQLDQIWRLLAVAVPWLVANQNQVNHVDFWWTVTMGKSILESGRLVAAGGQFFTPTTESFVGTQWLAQVLLYLVYASTGLAGVLVLRGVIVAATAALILLACERLGAGPRAAAACTIAAGILSLGGAAERPQMFAILPFAAFALTLTQRRVGWRTLVGLPFLMIFWVNVHGSFVLGLGLAGLVVAARLWAVARHEIRLTGLGAGGSARAVAAASLGDPELRRRLLLFAGVSLATLASPLGVRSYQYFVALQSNEYVRSAAVEWRPTSLAVTFGWLVLAALFAAIAILKLSRSRPSLIEAVTMFGFTILAMLAVRNVVWWAIVCAPVVARLLADIPIPKQRTAASPDSPRPRVTPRPGMARAIQLLIVLGLVLLSPPLRGALRSSEASGDRLLLNAQTPVGVADFLASSGIRGRAFVDSTWTGYLAWRLRDREVQYFADNRFEIHPAEVWEENRLVGSGHATWQAVLDRYRVDWLILDLEAQKRLVPLVRESPLWREVYADNRGIIYVRQEASGGTDGR